MPDKLTKPALFTPDWWTLRHAVMAEIAASQARLRKALPLPEERDVIVQRLRAKASEAAMTLALYGDDPKRTDTIELRDAWEAALETLHRHRAASETRAAA